MAQEVLANYQAFLRLLFCSLFLAIFSCNLEKGEIEESADSPALTEFTSKNKTHSMEQFTKVIASIVIWHEDQLLLFKRKSNFNELDTGKDIWDLPGGKVDFGEKISETIQRELTEETASFQINPSLSLLDILSYTISDSSRVTHRINLVYSMEYDTVPSITLSKEHSEYRFTKEVSDIRQLKMMPPVKAFIIEQFDNRNLN